MRAVTREDAARDRAPVDGPGRWVRFSRPAHLARVTGEFAESTAGKVGSGPREARRERRADRGILAGRSRVSAISSSRRPTHARPLLARKRRRSIRLHVRRLFVANSKLHATESSSVHRFEFLPNRDRDASRNSFRDSGSIEASRAVSCSEESAMHKSSRRLRQQELVFTSWGGARRGAGRKRAGPRARVPHGARPRHCARHPIHLTVRLREGLPSLRRKESRDAVAQAFAHARERFGFRMTQFSLQSNHLHLLAEADDRESISRGMQGLLVRIARALNALWKRSGSVFADRFHARALRTPREVRAALVYVLHNARRHGVRMTDVDPFSSGPWFDGWRSSSARVLVLPPILARARTWLLREGWLRHGRVGVHEYPASSHG